MTTNATPATPAAPAAIKIGQGREIHFTYEAHRPSAFCKGGRVHRARLYSNDLGKLTCAKCRARAVALGLLSL
jgi:hypothetical protein